MEGGSIIVDIMRDVALPIVTAIIGWFASIWRSKQKKEKDVLENVTQILDMQKTYIADQDEENRKTRDLNRLLEKKLDDKRESIRRANHCRYTAEGDGCPVLAHVFENAPDIDSVCEHIDERLETCSRQGLK